jgi:hypothetical protein
VLAARAFSFGSYNMITFIKVRFTKSMLGQLAHNNDTKTTMLGLAAGALLASQLDFGKLLQKDPDELGKAAGVVIAVLIGYWTNKPDKAQKEASAQ